MNTNQRGQISISAQLIRNNPDEVAEIFHIIKFLPVRAELIFITDNITYEGLSPRFKEIDIAEATPKYTLLVHKDEDGEYSVIVEVEEYN